MNPRVLAWMAATGETTLDGAGHRYAIWITGKWAEWKRLQGRRLESEFETFSDEYCSGYKRRKGQDDGLLDRPGGVPCQNP